MRILAIHQAADDAGPLGCGVPDGFSAVRRLETPAGPPELEGAEPVERAGA